LELDKCSRVDSTYVSESFFLLLPPSLLSLPLSKVTNTLSHTDKRKHTNTKKDGGVFLVGGSSAEELTAGSTRTAEELTAGSTRRDGAFWHHHKKTTSRTSLVSLFFHTSLSLSLFLSLSLSLSLSLKLSGMHLTGAENPIFADVERQQSSMLTCVDLRHNNLDGGMDATLVTVLGDA
jgi:hypothetical protein